MPGNEGRFHKCLEHHNSLWWYLWSLSQSTNTPPVLQAIDCHFPGLERPLSPLAMEMGGWKEAHLPTDPLLLAFPMGELNFLPANRSENPSSTTWGGEWGWRGLSTFWPPRSQKKEGQALELGTLSQHAILQDHSDVHGDTLDHI